MSKFTLAISCLTTSNLPWFMDLIFRIPMQYCTLQHQTLLPSPIISTTGCCFHFDSVSSFFLELFLHWSPVAYWAPTNLGSLSFSVLSFCLFILFLACKLYKNRQWAPFVPWAGAYPPFWGKDCLWNVKHNSHIVQGAQKTMYKCSHFFQTRYSWKQQGENNFVNSQRDHYVYKHTGTL